MSELAIIIAVLLLWSIARSLKRIIRIISGATIDINFTTVPSGGGEPVETPRRPGNVISFKRRA